MLAHGVGRQRANQPVDQTQTPYGSFCSSPSLLFRVMVSRSTCRLAVGPQPSGRDAVGVCDSLDRRPLRRARTALAWIATRPPPAVHVLHAAAAQRSSRKLRAAQPHSPQ